MSRLICEFENDVRTIQGLHFSPVRASFPALVMMSGVFEPWT